MSNDTTESTPTEDLTETRRLATAADATDTTTVLPTAADATDTTTLAAVDDTIAETRPLTTIDDTQQTIALESVADLEEGETRETTPADGETAETQRMDAAASANANVRTHAERPVGGVDKTLPIGDIPLMHGDAPIPSADDIPMYGTGGTTSPAAASTLRPNSGQPTGARSIADSRARQPVNGPSGATADHDSGNKRNASTPTIIFGLLGLLIGVLGLAFGVTFPNMLIPRFTADPQVLVAIICAVVGVILVVVAIVWAALGAVKNKSSEA